MSGYVAELSDLTGWTKDS